MAKEKILPFLIYKYFIKLLLNRKFFLKSPILCRIIQIHGGFPHVLPIIICILFEFMYKFSWRFLCLI